MMPIKPQFDPKFHLSETKKKQMEDEELARRLQREMEAEDTAELDRVQQHQANQQEIDDMALARRLQFGDDTPDDPMQRHLEERQRETGITDRLEYARSLQHQALRDLHSAPPSRGTQFKASIDDEDEDPDLALARRMNEMYEMGLDSCSNFESFETLRNNDPTSTDRSLGSSHISSQRRSQEEEDAAIARMMAESGESFRDLDLNNLPPPGARSRLSTPGAHHVPIPVGYSDAMRQAAANANTNIPAIQAVKSGDDSFTRRSQPAVPRTRRSLTQQDNPLSTLPEEKIPPNMVDMDSIGVDVSNSDTKASKAKSKPRAGLFGLGILPKPPTLDFERLSPRPSKPWIKVNARPPPKRKPGPVPYSISASRQIDIPIEASAVPKRKTPRPSRNSHVCDACKRPATHYLTALDKRYHHDCFRCMGCHNLIDIASPFAYMQDEAGEKHPLHKECFSELYGVKCAVCHQTIPAGPDGKVSFVKHPFFDREQMCSSHAANPGRRCTGCHRFEPENEPFADLGDSGRVVCHSCCRTAVVDNSDAEPLWKAVISFFETKLNLPIWADMREVPVLVVGYKSLNEQLKQTGGVHTGSAQIMTRGVCLTEHQTSGRKLKTTSLRFNERSQSFERRDEHQKGFTFLQVPHANKVNPDSSITCILCLSGLPKDLTASVLAHEATHAWIKLHPRYDVMNPLDPQVEEGCAQLVAMLFLSEGLPPASKETDVDGGPSEEKLRQYFKFSIESDNNEIYGEGYRKAAAAYSKIGIEALLSHVVLYKDFPKV